MRTYHVYEIDWDTDGEKVKLPSEFDIDIDVEGLSKEEIAEELSDKISDEYGWCHNGFCYKRKRR